MLFFLSRKKSIACPQFGLIYRTRGFFKTSKARGRAYLWDGCPNYKQPSTFLRSINHQPSTFSNLCKIWVEAWALWRWVVAFHYSLARFGGHSIIGRSGCRLIWLELGFWSQQKWMVKMCHIELMILSQNDVSVQYLVFARVVLYSLVQLSFMLLHEY